jgi:hypothetical protein
MDSLHEDDGSTSQSALALPFNITAGLTGGHFEQLPMESQALSALQPRPGLGGRELYSKEQWESQKPIIRQLYNLENKPYKRVIELLRTEHNFIPTYAIQFFVS